MKIAIPSYNREKILCNKTLKTLENSGVDFNDIDLFLYDTNQREKYEIELMKHYGKIPINIITTNILDLGERLNLILNKYYEEGEEILLIEDDIRGVIEGGRGGEDVNILDLCKKGFEECKNNNLYIWGISPTDSKRYQPKTPITTDYKFIIGVLYGVICRRCLDLDVKYTYKSDFERTILYYKKDKGVVRFNHISVKTTYRAQGGLGNDNKNGREAKELEAVKNMINDYGDYCYMVKNNPREIKLRRKIPTE